MTGSCCRWPPRASAVEKVKRLVAHERAADGEARLLRVLRRERVGHRQAADGQRARRRPVLVAVEVEQLAVDVVAAALGDGFDDRADAADVLRVVLRADDLELLDGGLGEGERRARA